MSDTAAAAPLAPLTSDEQLAELSRLGVDSGKRALERFNYLKSGGVPDPVTFSRLTPDEQRALLGHVRDQEGVAPIALAIRFGVNLSAIRALLAYTDEQLGLQTLRTTHFAHVGRLVAAAETATDQLAKEGKWLAYWKVHRELHQDLQRLGVIREVPRALQVQHEHALRTDQAAEIDRLLELERKRDARLEEIQRAKVELLDPLPALGTQDPGDLS